MIQKLIIAAAVFGLVIGAIATPSAADGGGGGGSAAVKVAVEGRGYFTGQIGTDGNLIIEFGCAATTTGAVASGTGVSSCVLYSDGWPYFYGNTGSMFGNAVVTIPNVVFGVPLAPLKVCWEANALLLSGQVIYDTTTPNCTTTNLPLLGF